jgi:predicted RNA-binding Zn-ribbon protein involved in translation (DUF1610 family)
MPRVFEARYYGRCAACDERITPGDEVAYDTVPCPQCGAAAGEACKRPAKRGPADCAPHPSRVEAAGQAA